VLIVPAIAILMLAAPQAESVAPRTSCELASERPSAPMPDGDVPIRLTCGSRVLDLGEAREATMAPGPNGQIAVVLHTSRGDKLAVYDPTRGGLRQAHRMLQPRQQRDSAEDWGQPSDGARVSVSSAGNRVVRTWRTGRP
jgi:hypothetical protein